MSGTHRTSSTETLPIAAPAAVCAHVYADGHGPCPHLVPPGADRCIWHNRAVRKDDAYVARVVAQAVRAARGDLAEAALAGLHAPGLQLAGADLRRADLRDAMLDGADLAGARLGGAVLRRASLKRAGLRGADLAGADLAGTSLAGADLAGAVLTGAVLDGTVLKDATADDADFTGADIRLVRWNRRARLGQARGLPPELAAAVAGPEPSDDDPTADESRVWAAPVGHPSAARPAAVAASDLLAIDGPNPAPSPAPSRRGGRMLLLAAAVLAVAGTLVGAWGLRTARAAPSDATRLAAELSVATSQAEANLAEVRRLQAAAAALEDAATAARTDSARARDESQLRRAEAEDARRRLVAAETELQRLRDADDRAGLMALRLAEAQRIGREQALQLGKQERIGGILSEGVRQLRDENAKLAAAAEHRAEEGRHIDELTAQVATLTRELDGVRADRDALAARERRLNADLGESQRAIQGYLARVAEADLGLVLGDDADKQPLLPVKAGAAIALGGDYLISLRLDPSDGGVSARLVVQRPAASANPDISVVLYDRDERPLRRLGFGFPHVDAGVPFASASATVACDQFPAFARVIVSPAASPPVGMRSAH